MGFAGQVFAARVAVGLALPSPSAFSQAGEQIGKFTGQMYGRLNVQSKEAAKKNLADSEKNLAAGRERMATHMKTQQSSLKANAQRSVAALTGVMNQLGQATEISAKRQGDIGKLVPKPVRTKLFANVSKDMSDAARYTQMMENFIMLSKEERKVVMEAGRSEVIALKASINTEEKRLALGKDSVTNIKDQIAERASFADQMSHFDKEGTNAELKHANTSKKIAKDNKKLEKEVIERKKVLNDLIKQGVRNIKAYGKAFGEAAGALKRGFSDALRESIATLTAFYYKLNQNTQQIVEFERALMNANSVFRITNSELFNVGETVIQFGQRFGLEMQNGAEGLYQLASAGLTANESMELLPHTLKLSMAVQGDHNTISKLTAQTIFGFGMEMSQAAEVTDKFAHAIQKSLIEYEDLSSAVKFALPFFTTTGQSIDQLLGALAVLTNRALEAGIAGRGLRQGLAELAESVGDNTAAFRKLGIEVTNQQGDMLQLTEIAANFAATLEAGVINDTELLTMLIEDLNVRGATAFVHLVQASDEFTEAVKSSSEAGGELDEMVRIQNASISAQIQILQNNVAAIFMMRDASYEGTEFMNAFHEAITNGVQSLKDLLVVEKDGTMVLTEMGKQLQDIAVTGVGMFVQILEDLIPLMQEFVREGVLNVELLKIYLIPLQLLVAAVDLIGPGMVKLIVAMRLMTTLMPLQTLVALAYASGMATVGASSMKAAEGQTAFNLAFSLTPWGRVALIVIAVGAALLYVGRNSEALKDTMFAIWKFVEHLGAAAVYLLTPFKDLGSYIAGAFSDDWFAIQKFFEHLFGFLEWKLGLWKEYFKEQMESGSEFRNFLDGWWEIGEAIDYAINKIVDLFASLIQGWKDFRAFMDANMTGSYSKDSKATEDLGWRNKDMEQVANLSPAARLLVEAGKLWYNINPFDDRALGGPVSPMYAARGGSGGGPYIVGERGPEVFVPKTHGRVIPNKDLNTQRVQSMLGNAFNNAPTNGASGRGGGVMMVSALNVGSANLRRTKLGVDVFG